MDFPEKHGLLGGNNDTDSEGYDYQPKQSNSPHRFCFYGAFAFVLLSTTIVSVAATIILFLHYHTLGDHYMKLQNQYAALEQQKIAIEKHIHVETSAHGRCVTKISKLRLTGDQQDLYPKSQRHITRRLLTTTWRTKTSQTSYGTPSTSTPASSPSPTTTQEKRVCQSPSDSPGTRQKGSTS